MERAYSRLEIKAFDDERREFSGIATTPSPDRLGDIVEPEGAKYTLPIPLLWQHRSDQPIGEVYEVRVSKKGIDIKGRVFQAKQSRTLMERLDEAWESMKLKLVRGLSIGFNPLESAQIKDTYSYRYLQWEWLELSPVTIPANAEGTIHTIKSIDRGLRAASGLRDGVVFLDDQPRRVRRKSGVVYLDPDTMRNRS
jgi:HK97 family phage prohead protease